jgi:hypothetical protein
MFLTQTGRYRDSASAAPNQIGCGPTSKGVVLLEATIVFVREATQTLQVPEGILISAIGGSKHQNESPGANLGGLLDVAIEIAAKRRDILRRMRAALLNSNDQEALDCARQLCGVEL